MKKYALAIISTLAMLSSATAADLMVFTEPSQPVDTSFVSSPIYFQLLGGAVFGSDVTFSGPIVDPTRVGYAVAGTIGYNFGAGFSVEADILRTFRNEVAAGLDTYGTTSLIGNVKYTLPVADAFGVYGAVGVGQIWVDNFDGPPVNTTFNFSGFGYQLIAGVNVEFNDNISGLVEVRYQDTFADYDLGGGATVDIPTVSVLGGVKLSF